MKRADVIRARMDTLRSDLESLEQVEEKGEDDQSIDDARVRSRGATRRVGRPED